MTGAPDQVVRLLLCGDVMTGRGVDQILPHPGDPTLQERYVHDARRYVGLAEAVNGLIPRPVDFSWPWGDALHIIDDAAADLWLVNLETSITRSDDYEPGKAVHYRMNPANLPCVAAADVDICTIANNHAHARSGSRSCESFCWAIKNVCWQRSSASTGQPQSRAA